MVYTHSSGWTTIKEITALYGQSISDEFPIEGTDGIEYIGARWKDKDENTYDYVLTYIDIMPDADVIFHQNTNGPGTIRTINYYVEVLPGETGKEFGDKEFILYKSVPCDYRIFTEEEDYIELPGFKKFATDPIAPWHDGDVYNVDCYYTRNEYTINFMDGSYYDGNG